MYSYIYTDFPASNGGVDTGENQPIREGNDGTEVMTRLSEQHLESTRVFIEASEILLVIFLINQEAQKFNNQRCMDIMYRFNFTFKFTFKRGFGGRMPLFLFIFHTF
jgi:hypothetical protein